MKSIITSREKKIYERIIEDATVDCNDEYEQISGWICLLDENIATPCNCTIGKQSTVLEKIDGVHNTACIVGIIRLGKSKIILMPTNIGTKMGHKEIILKYLKEKSNEDDVIALLQEQKKWLANPGKNSILLNDEYLSLIIKLAKNSNRKIKSHAIIILSNVEYYMGAKNFYELCRIAAECSSDKDGNIRQASFILIKNLNALMITLPLINKLQNASNAEVNLFYESFRNLFIRLYFSFYNEHNQDLAWQIE